MENFINVKAKIIDKKYFNSKTIILVYEIENISTNSFQDVYFKFNIKQYGRIKRIILEKNKKYTSYMSSYIYISNIHKREKIYLGIIISLNDDNEKICPIELNITFNDYLGKNYEKRVVKYLKNEDSYEKYQEEILFLYTSRKYVKYKDIIKYRILLINNVYKEVRDIIIPINIPQKTRYIKDSLIIDGIKKRENVTSIQVKSLKINECICIEYSVEIDSITKDENIINNVRIVFTSSDGNHVNMDKSIITKVRNSRI